MFAFWGVNKLNLPRHYHYALLFISYWESAAFFNRQYKRNLNNFLVENSAGVPFFNDKKNLIDLNKTYFFLDDDNNYKPSLWYHGRVNGFVKPDGLL